MSQNVINPADYSTVRKDFRKEKITKIVSNIWISANGFDRGYFDEDLINECVKQIEDTLDGE